MALEHFKTQVLLLHSQQSTLDVLSSGIGDRYSVHCATSGTEALNTLHDTPIHVIVFAQDLPGMSGLDALREAKKRSPDTIGILLAGNEQPDELEALVGAKDVFQIIRGKVEPAALIELIESATKQVRLLALSESANDQRANVDEPVAEHIVMETSEHGAAIISDGTGQFPALNPQKIDIGAGAGSRAVDVLVLTKDEEFLATIKDSARGLHNIHHSVTPSQAEEVVNKHKVGVLVTDAAMVGSNIEALTQKLRACAPRLVAIVAGRRDDGEMLMDLINRGHVYRFLLKPVSPGRSRLAIEASVKHHLEAPDTAFKGKPKPPATKPTVKPSLVSIRPVAKAAPPSAAKPAPAPTPLPRRRVEVTKPPVPKPAAKPAAAVTPVTPVTPAVRNSHDRPMQKITPTISDSPLDDIPMDVSLDDSFPDDNSFTDTMTGIAASVGKSISGATSSASDSAQGMVKASGAAAAGLVGRFSDSFAKPKTLAIAGSAVVALVLAGWIATSWESTPDVVTADTQADINESAVSRVVTPPPGRPPATDARNSQQQVATAPVTEASLTPEAPATAESNIELLEARDARDAGRLISPAADNAVELYVDALSRAPNDAVIQSELDAVVNQVLTLAETSLLASDAEGAANALNMVQLADADNPRLTFLSAQLTQLQLRETAEQARIAIRAGQFDQAATLIAKAELLAGPDAVELRLLSEDLISAQNADAASQIITLANERLEAGDLTTPANDNASYFFKQALEVDAENLAAQQGLIAVASKLALQARATIDAGELDAAQRMLDDAREIDPGSAELRTTTTTLNDAREAIAAAQRQAEVERLAEIERQAELQRQAELERQVELQRQAEAQRQAELERQAESERLAAASRQAELDRQAELQRQVERQAQLDRQAELDRRAEEARQAEATRQAEADKIAARQRQVAAAEEARIRAEQDAASAATSSPLGVAGSSVAKSATPTAGPAVSRPQAVATNAPPAAGSTPLPRTYAAPAENRSPASQASTFAVPDNPGQSTTPQVSRSLPTNTASRQAALVGGATIGAATTAAGARSEPEMVPVSRLTRTNYVAPEYPRVARRRNVTGSVDVTFTVTTDGKVRSASVLKSEPKETFDQAAIDAVTKWRFEPSVENGVAVEKRTAVRLAFDLQ